MNAQPPLAPVNPQQPENSWSKTYLKDESTSTRKSPLAWWYRLTAPPEPSASASFRIRDAVRRGKLASTLALLLSIVLITIDGLSIVLHLQIVILAVTMLLLVLTVALAFNRAGHPNISGIIIVLGLNTSLITVIRIAPGGLDPSALALFDILVFVELFAASLLPVNWVFLFAALNIAFILYDIPHQPWDAAMALTMHANFGAVLFRPIAVHAVVTIVLWLWVRNATQALERADRAEVIATLEHEIAMQEHSVAEEKNKLDVSIQQILNTHMRVSNGDFNARMSIGEGEPLWVIASSLNNLIARLQRLQQTEQKMLPSVQRLQQTEYELQRLKNSIHSMLLSIRQAESAQKPISLRPSGTLLDPLAASLHSKQLVAPPASLLPNSEHPAM